MANDIAVIDRFLDIFSRYIDSGFGLISGDVGFLVKVLIGIDVVLAALAWAAGEDEVIQAFAKKVLYVGFFAFILNNWNSLAQAIFKSFAALGLRATGSSLSYADFLRPGKLAQAGVQGADVLLAQIQRLSGFPEVFWNLSEIMLMALAWVVTLIAFFVLAIMLFLAVIEFKLTTLKGFILVPFALWRGTSFIAEPVPARSPRRRRLAVQHALLTPWAALLQAARLWLALVEASSVLLAQASRQQRAGCGRPATELPRGWLNASAPASARAGPRLEDQQSARPPKALVWLVRHGRRAGRGNFAGSR